MSDHNSFPEETKIRPAWTSDLEKEISEIPMRNP